MVVKGRYIIGLFATKPIHFGDELVFDYASVTESEKEHKSAVCLCGSRLCQGSYLALVGEEKNWDFLYNKHNILARSAMLLRACVEKITDEERHKLIKNCIGTSMLSGLAGWAVKFCALICGFLELEKQYLPEQLKDEGYSDTEAVTEAFGVAQQRLMHLAISLDKVKYFLRQQRPTTRVLPPLRKLRTAEMVDILWNSSESFVNVLVV